jgi:hypothetical protein
VKASSQNCMIISQYLSAARPDNALIETPAMISGMCLPSNFGKLNDPVCSAPCALLDGPHARVNEGNPAFRMARKAQPRNKTIMRQRPDLPNGVRSFPNTTCYPLLQKSPEGGDGKGGECFRRLDRRRAGSGDLRGWSSRSLGPKLEVSTNADGAVSFLRPTEARCG